MPDFDDIDLGVTSTAAFEDFEAPASQANIDRALGNNSGLLGTTAAMAAFAVPDAIDTVSASLGFTDRGQINESIVSSSPIASVSLRKWYNENEGAIAIGSGIAAIVAADYSAGRFLRPTSAAMRFVAGKPFVGKLATLDKKYLQAMTIAQKARQESAIAGAMATEAYTGNVTLARLGMSPLTTTPNKARALFVGAAAKKGLARNVTTEALLGVFANESFLYEGDLADNLAWNAVGLGLGAGVDILQAKHIVKKFANDDVTKRLFAKAYDPFETEAARIQSSLADFNSMTGSKSHMGDMSGGITDTVTSLAISAGEGRNAAALAGGKRNPLFAKRERLSTQIDQEVQNTANKATVKGVTQIPGTGFAMSEPVTGETVAHMLYLDPTALHGVEQLGRAPRGMSIADIGPERKVKLEQRMSLLSQTLIDGGFKIKRKVKDKATGKVLEVDGIRKLKPEQLADLRDEYRALIHDNSMVEVRFLDGERVPPQIGDMFADFEMPKMNHEWAADELIVGTKEAAGKNIGVSNRLNVFLPKGRTLDNMSLADSVALHTAGGDIIRWHQQTGKVMNLPAKPTWFQLDMAETLIRKTGDEASVQFPANLTRETAMVEAFKQRAKAVSTRLAKNPTDSVAAAEARFIFNLPRLDAHTAGLLDQSDHPIETILRGLNEMPVDALKNITYQDLKQGFEDARLINQLGADAATRSDDFIGNMFDFNKTNQGKPMEQLVAFVRPTVPFEWTKDNLAERLAFRKAMTAKVLTGEGSGDMNRMISQALYNDPDMALASRVSGLQDSQLQSMLPGFNKATPQSATGGVLNDNVYRDWRDRDTIELQAASRLRDKIDRLARSHMKARIDSELGDVLGKINGPANGSSRLLLNQFLTYRSGWDLKLAKGVPVTAMRTSPQGKELMAFVLDETSQQNITRWKKMFGVDIAKGAVMKSARGTDVVLDTLGLDFMTRFGKIANDLNVEKNGLNKAVGLGKINKLPLYTPPPSTKGKYIGFTLDINNRPLPGGTIVADNPEQFAKEQARLEDPANVDSPLNRNPDATFRRAQDVEDFNSIWDKAQMDFMDPGLTAIQPGRRAKGLLAGQDVNPYAIEDALTWARDSYLRHSGDIVKNIFKDQIVAAQTRAAIARDSTAQGDKAKKETKSIYDIWQDNLLGRASGDSEASATGRLFRGAEDYLDRVIREKAPTVSTTLRAALDWVQTRRPGDNSPKAIEEFKALSAALGPHMPFKTVTDFVDKNYGIKRPPEMVAITGAMSQFEATTRLRMFEVIHGVMNLGGIVNAIPSVVLHAQPMKGESAADHAIRNGISTIIDVGNGERIGVLSMPKLLLKTFKNTWNRKHDADWDYRVSQGYMSQEVAEYHRQMNSINDRGKWGKAILGDPKADSEVKRGGVVGLLSVLSDRSEDFSRSWGHLVGIELADNMGIVGREARESFAHEIANKMIANYDPRNRPAVFQGALGAPIGLFQSFIANYYQRMFRYIETGDTRALAAQMASQSAMFGITTVPGYGLVNEFMNKESIGNDDPLTSIYEKFGDDTADALLNGVIGNLPKLVNLLPGEQGVDGIAVYSRGDTAVRVPGLNPPPIVDSMSRVVAAVKQGIAAFKADGNWTQVEVAEIASNMLTNRPIAGFIEQAFGGDVGIGAADTDALGNVISESKTAMEVTARIIGVRSLRQQKELEAYYQNKNAQTTQNALKQDLNAAARRAIRNGDVESLPDYFAEYVQRGGDPRRFNSWVKRQMEAAQETRGERMLDDMDKNPSKAALMNRLLEMGVSPSELEESIDNPEQMEMTPEGESFGGTTGEIDANLIDDFQSE